MKLIIRIDDVGYSRAHNIGSFKAIDEGVATSADTMLDCPGTEEALEFLRIGPDNSRLAYSISEGRLC